jgi:hypothetical protein
MFSSIIISNSEDFRVALKNAIDVLVDHKTYPFNYDIDALMFSKSYNYVDTIIFDYREPTIDMYAFSILVNRYLENSNPDIERIICIDPTSIYNEYLIKLPFKSDIVVLSQIDDIINIKTLLQDKAQKLYIPNEKALRRRRQMLSRKPLSSLPNSKIKKFADLLVSIQISKEGIDSILISFDSPTNLNQLVKFSELLPIAYLEKYFAGTKVEKAQILGVDRMKYTRLSNIFKNESDEKTGNIFTKV